MVILSMLLSAQKLRKKILEDRYNAIVFEKGRGMDTYLVGGYVRDILRGLSSPDRDYVVNDDIQRFAEEIIKSIGGTIVEFRKNHMIRVAFKEGFTLDFSRPEGTIKDDLSKRDFTINAIAWSPDAGIIDPFKGLEDIKKKRIRSLSIENLKADPLRMLRAYRFAAEINGPIVKGTREAIKKLYKRIKKVSPERITLELFNLLNSNHPPKYLKMARSDGILKSILYIPDNILENNIKAISKFERGIKKLPSKVKVKLKKIFSQNLTYKGLLRLELLLRQRYLSPFEIPKLKMSNPIIKRILLTINCLNTIKESHLFDLFLKLGEASQDVLILSGRFDLLKEYERFNKVWKRGLLKSEKVSEITKIGPGPKLGRVIVTFKRAQFDRVIRNKRDAVRYLLNLT